MFFSDMQLVRGYERPHDADAADYSGTRAYGDNDDDYDAIADVSPLTSIYESEEGGGESGNDAGDVVFASAYVLPAPTPASDGKKLLAGAAIAYVVWRLFLR